MRILIVKPSSLGDILHTLPAVQRIHELHPEAVLDWVVNDTFADVARLSPFVQDVIPFPRSRAWNPLIFLKFCRRLRREHYDMVLDFQGLFRSGLISFLAKSSQRIGFACAREGSTAFYQKRVPIQNMHSHAVEKNLQLVQRAFGLQENAPCPVPKTQIHLEEAARKEAIQLCREEHIPSNAPRIAVCFSSRWPSKNWSPAFFTETIERTTNLFPTTPPHFLLIGSMADHALGQQLAEGHPHVHNLSGKTSFPVLAALLATTQCMLTVDSGPMHLAAAMGIRCLALFGSTDAVLTGPWGPKGFHRILQASCPHAPCLQRRCPHGRKCEDGTPPEEAARILSSLLSTKEYLP